MSKARSRLQSILADAKRRARAHLMNEVAREPVFSFVRDKSLSERQAISEGPRMPGMGLFFCLHGKSYFEACYSRTCNRSVSEGQENFDRFCKAKGLKGLESNEESFSKTFGDIT